MFRKPFQIRIPIYIVLIAAFSFTSCVHNKMIDKVENLMKSDLWIPEGCHGNTEYTVLRYIRPKSCTSCQLEMGRWRVYQKHLEKTYNGRVSVFFIVDTNNVKEAERLTSMYGFSGQTYMDSVGDFIRHNPAIDFFGSDVVVLLDSLGSIVAVGNPVKENKAYGLYEDMVNNSVLMI